MSCKGQLTLSNKVGRTCILQKKILVSRHSVSNSEREVGILFATSYREQNPVCIRGCLSSVFLIGVELAPSASHFCQSTSNQPYTYRERIKLAQTLFTRKSLVEHSKKGVKN